MHIGGLKIVARDHGDPGVDPLLDRFPQQMFEHRAHSKITHVERILHDDSLQLLSAHCVDERLAAIEPNENYFARLANILQGKEHSGSRRFVRAKNSLHLVAEVVEEILGRALSRVARGACMLISGEQFNASIR